MYRYRIYTEDLNRSEITAIVAETFDGFTIFDADGVWEGKSECSMVIEVILLYDALPMLKRLAKRIKEHNDQKSVLLTQDIIGGEFLV